MPAGWASSAGGDGPERMMAFFQEGLPVRLIATDRGEFRTCAPDETLPAVVERNRDDRVDFIPVVEPSSTDHRVIGLADISGFMNGPVPDKRIRGIMRPLAEDNLIGADAGILAFVRDADHRPFRFVVSGHRIDGLVCLSDLQRIPVRAALFAMVTHLEIVMADAIRREFGRSPAWIERLSDRRQEKLHEEFRRSRAQDSFVDTLLFTQFADKATIIRKSPHCPWVKSAFTDELSAVQSLRDLLAHSNDYAATRDAAVETCERVRLMDKWSGLLAGWLVG